MIEQPDSPARARLVGETVACAALDRAQVDAMLRLFQTFYDQVEPALFLRDLAQKDQVILLRDEEQGVLRGFSTLALYERCIHGQRMSVVYSGDTIVEPDYWGTPELPSHWIKSVLALSFELAQPLYWLLIASGYKSYRFLPVLYREFYPCYLRPTPADAQALIDALAADRFGADYDARSGIVRFRQGATPLRPGLAEVSAERLRNPHIRYFVARNPGHVEGDELVCLTRIHPDNFTPAGLRMVG
jgi:hypothetical protein